MAGFGARPGRAEGRRGGGGARRQRVVLPRAAVRLPEAAR